MNKSYPGSLHGTKEDRKAAPIVSGLLWYFPDALAAVAHVSVVGNDQHNPGEPLHDARGKSNDDLDCAGRHLAHAGTLDDDKVRHTAKLAWRALRALQKELEEAYNLPLPRNARLPIEDVWMGGNAPPVLPASIAGLRDGSPYSDWHGACGAASSEEEITEAIEGIAAEGPKDGWYDWNPTPGQRDLILPVHKDTVIRCRFRDGSERVDRAGSLDWWHSSEPTIDWPGDLIAFRVETAPLEVSDFSNALYETPHSFLTKHPTDAPWIEWKHGSKVPRELVDIKFQDGAKVYGINPASVNWWSNNLVAYRMADGADNGNPSDDS